MCLTFFKIQELGVYNLEEFDRSTVCFVFFVFISEFCVTLVDFPSLIKF